MQVENAPNLIGIVMDKHDMTLAQFILKQQRRASEYIIWAFLRDISTAFRMLHCDLKILHRDVNLNNIVLDEKENMTFKLIDFGFSTPSLDPPHSISVVTSGWVAPEVQSGTDYSKPADIYSLALCCLSLGSGSVDPAKREDQLSSEVYGEELVALVSDMMNENPVERPSASDIFQQSIAKLRDFEHWYPLIRNREILIRDKIIKNGIRESQENILNQTKRDLEEIQDKLAKIEDDLYYI